MSYKKEDIEKLSSKDYLIVKEASTNNLKAISVAITRDKITVITGLSGSGKSSLAFDTIYKESRRMYIESLSAYARNLFGKIETPDVKQILGLTPAIAIQQKTTTGSSKSSIATVTEIFNYLKLLFSRVGETISPVSGKKVKKDSPESVYDEIINMHGEKILLLYKLEYKQGKLIEHLNVELAKGFFRIFVNEEVREIEEFTKGKDIEKKIQEVYILVDRYLIKKNDESQRSRMVDSIETAFYEGKGNAYIFFPEKNTFRKYSDKFELDGIMFEEPTPSFFTYNNAYGSCKNCNGESTVIGIDHDKVIPNQDISIYDGVIAPWQQPVIKSWQDEFLRKGRMCDFPIHKSYNELSEEEKYIVWHGDIRSGIKGINEFFSFLKENIRQPKYAVLYHRYLGRVPCSKCRGTKIREDANFVKVAGKSIIDIMLMNIEELNNFFQNINLTDYQLCIAKRLVEEIRSRVNYLMRVGLGYLSLMRTIPTLSGGEFQRVMLANSLGNVLVGTTYILDEPTIGLHPRDTEILLGIIKSLRDIGNTVIIVEHDEEVMRVADEIIDIGPSAGRLGGEVVFQGNWDELKKFSESYTAKYLNGHMVIAIPQERRSSNKFIEIERCSANNLKGFNAKIPLGTLTAITGVSGSGKSTFIEEIIYPFLAYHTGSGTYMPSYNPRNHGKISYDSSAVKGVEMITQKAISASSRSTPMSYVGAYDNIRAIFSRVPEAKEKGFDSSYFSYNTGVGACPDCEGSGKIIVDMQFMSDVSMECELCRGKKFQEEVLEIKYKDKNIYDVLNMTIDEALDFFKESKSLIKKLSPLETVGLGYIKLGQSTDTLSGGESQRLKLSLYLGAYLEPSVFIFDEPTTGLHVHDVAVLLDALNALVEQGHTVIVVEHNLDVIKSADYVLDLGPESGEEGGNLVFQGTPEELLKNEKSYTAKYLKSKF